MTTATVTPNTPRTATSNQPALVKSQAIIPIKVGMFGGQGSGKTTSAALLALALSKELHGGAPVMVTDTEPGWQFLKPLFAIEKVELIQRTVPTFKAMLFDIQDAEKLGCCVWAGDSLTVMWNELMQSFKAKNNGRIPINVWGDIKQLWGAYTTLFLNSKMHCFALGRLGNVMEDVADEDNNGKTKLVKTGTQFKAGGSESFGYEPHLLLELSLERKAKMKAGSKIEGEGRMIHRVDVLKDRTWALNGRVIRWSDSPQYRPGGYSTVWQSIKPHFECVQKTMAMVTLDTSQRQSSEDLIRGDNDNSEWYRNQQRRKVLAEELHCAMDALWGGTAVAAKQMRMEVFMHIFGFRSKEAADAADLATIERGVRIMQAFEKRCQKDASILTGSKENLLAHLDIDIREHDEHTAEESELPF
jgi:hypothetical protein